MTQVLSNSKWPERLTRKDACDYLLEVHGIRRAPTTLMKLAWKGGGPRYIKIGNAQVLYPRDELDRWANALMSAPISIASELQRA